MGTTITTSNHMNYKVHAAGCTDIRMTRYSVNATIRNLAALDEALTILSGCEYYYNIKPCARAILSN